MKKIFLLLILCNIAIPAYANGDISLQTLITNARKNNPELKYFKKIYQSAQNNIDFISAWPNPKVGYEFMKDNNKLYLSQEFFSPKKISYKKNSASNLANALNEKFKQKTLELDAKVKKTFWEYWLTYKNMAIYKENILLTQNFLEAAKSKYIVGKVTEADVLTAKSDLGRMKGMLVIAEYEFDSLKSELNILMDKKPDEPLGFPEDIDINEKEINYSIIEQKALANNYSLLEKNYIRQKSLDESKLSKMEWLPNLMAEAKISDISDKNIFMVSAQIPLYFWNRISDIKTKTCLAEAENEMLKSEKNSVLLSLKSICLQYNRNLKLIKIYETDILPSSKQAAEISEEWYKGGKIDFQQMLNLQKKYLDEKIEYNKLIAESRMYYAELEMLSGGIIE